MGSVRVVPGVVQAVFDKKDVFARERKHVGVGYGAPNLMGEGLPEAKFRAGARENDESLSERP